MIPLLPRTYCCTAVLPCHYFVIVVLTYRDRMIQYHQLIYFRPPYRPATGILREYPSAPLVFSLVRPRLDYNNTQVDNSVFLKVACGCTLLREQALSAKREMNTAISDHRTGSPDNPRQGAGAYFLLIEMFVDRARDVFCYHYPPWCINVCQI